MRIIGIDTSTKATGLALWADGQVEACHIERQEKTRAEKMLPILVQLMEEQELSFDQVDAIAVAQGPGSFTGLRVGVTVAKTMAQFSDKLLVGVSTLKALAWSARQEAEDYLICPVIDARADRVFTAAYCYKPEESELKELSIEELTREEVLLERLPKLLEENQLAGILWVGQGIENHPALSQSPNYKSKIYQGESKDSPVVAICQLGAQALAAGKSDSYLDLKPNYLRKSQAERDRERKAGS